MTEAGVRVKVAFLVTRDGKGGIGIGDCIVITFDDKDDASRRKCIVIDGGYSKTAKVLKSYLDGENITTIDLVVATHVDDDHINGLKAFFADYVDENEPIKVLNYWGPEPKRPDPITISEFIAFLPDVNDLEVKELSFISQSVDSNEELWESAKKRSARHICGIRLSKGAIAFRHSLVELKSKSWARTDRSPALSSNPPARPPGPLKKPSYPMPKSTSATRGSKK